MLSRVVPFVAGLRALLTLQSSSRCRATCTSPTLSANHCGLSALRARLRAWLPRCVPLGPSDRAHLCASVLTFAPIPFRFVAFLRKNEVWVAAMDGTTPAWQVTSGFAETGRTNGVADFLAQEEMDRYDGFWWSPDSTKIAFEGVSGESTGFHCR